MEHYAGIDVSLESASLCVVDATGRIVREAKVASEPEILIGWFRGLARISHSGVDFRVAERERTGEHVKKVAVVG